MTRIKMSDVQRACVRAYVRASANDIEKKSMSAKAFEPEINRFNIEISPAVDRLPRGMETKEGRAEKETERAREIEIER